MANFMYSVNFFLEVCACNENSFMVLNIYLFIDVRVECVREKIGIFDARCTSDVCFIAQIRHMSSHNLHAIACRCTHIYIWKLQHELCIVIGKMSSKKTIKNAIFSNFSRTRDMNTKTQFGFFPCNYCISLNNNG